MQEKDYSKGRIRIFGAALCASGGVVRRCGDPGVSWVMFDQVYRETFSKDQGPHRSTFRAGIFR
jgi:hypothetical protein